jgi:voltage-gated potassium channel
VWIDSSSRRLARVVFAVAALVMVGTLGYSIVEGWSLADGFFMTVITLSTVGYGETLPLSEEGRTFTATLIFLCLLCMTWLTATLTSILVEDDLSGRRYRRRLLKMIDKLKDHTIVCGSGLMAQAVVERLMRKRASVVVIDSNAEQLAAMKHRFRNLYVVDGDATSELILAEAGLLSAKHVVAALDCDVDNLMIAITCKDMGRDIGVFARSNDTAVANRMRKAGVDEVVSPSQICGDRFAELVLAGNSVGIPS